MRCTMGRMNHHKHSQLQVFFPYLYIISTAQLFTEQLVVRFTDVGDGQVSCKAAGKSNHNLKVVYFLDTTQQ